MARLHRQDLKHDEFVDSVDQVRSYLEEHGRRLGAIALLVVVAGTSVGGYLWHQRVQEEEANVLLSSALVTFNASVQVGLPPLPGQEDSVFSSEEAKWAAAIEKFAAVYEQYPGTLAGTVARHYEGISRYHAGETDQAIAILEEVARSGRRNAVALAKYHLTSIYLEQGRKDDAEKAYRDLLAHPVETVPTAMVKLDLAALLASEHPEEARTLYEQVRDENPDTPMAAAATIRLELLPAAAE